VLTDFITTSNFILISYPLKYFKFYERQDLIYSYGILTYIYIYIYIYVPSLIYIQMAF